MLVLDPRAKLEMRDGKPVCVDPASSVVFVNVDTIKRGW
jgi:hypothetical protein